jgi:hypothetical protein
VLKGRIRNHGWRGFPEAQELDAPGRRQLLQGYVDVLLLRDGSADKILHPSGIKTIRELNLLASCPTTRSNAEF